MKNLKSNNKGVLLILVAIIIIVITILTSAYLSRLVNEKRSFSDERSVFQALSLSESSANLGFAELNRRFPQDLNDKLVNITDPAIIRPYVDNNHPLEFLRDYAYPTIASKFTIDNSTTPPIAYITIALPDYLSKGSDWNSNATITVFPVNCTKTADEGPFQFNYKYKIEAKTRIWQGPGPDLTKGTADDKYGTKVISYAPNSFLVEALHGNFDKFALFTAHHRAYPNTTVWFTANTNFTGPVHTNERFSFANNPSGNFTALASQSLPDAHFYNSGNDKYANSEKYPINCVGAACKDKPVFSADGFLRSQPVINLPSSLNQAQFKTKATGGTEPGSNGIWLPNTGGVLTAGIYIKGSTSSTTDNPTITMSVDSSDRPVYTITQGTNKKTITVNYTSNTTTVVNTSGSGGTAAGTYTGVPNGTGHEGITIYTNDDVGYWDQDHPSNNIAGLSGVVQQNTKVTVSSEKDLMITGNVTYEKDPTISGNEGYDNILGILSWNGNVRIGTAAPHDITIDGVVMAPNPTEIGGKGLFCVDNYNDNYSPHLGDRGVATLLGGVISDWYGAFGTFGSGDPTGYGRNFVYDTRVRDRTLAPPYFPYMTTFSARLVPTDIFKTRTPWREEER